MNKYRRWALQEARIEKLEAFVRATGNRWSDVEYNDRYELVDHEQYGDCISVEYERTPLGKHHKHAYATLRRWFRPGRSYLEEA